VKTTEIIYSVYKCSPFTIYHMLA